MATPDQKKLWTEMKLGYEDQDGWHWIITPGVLSELQLDEDQRDELLDERVNLGDEELNNE